MTLTRSIAMAMIVAALGVGGSQTQAQDSRSQPAEFPPSSYKGKQYVDSAGCVFIRAGIDGNVSWVPRMSRAREQICGFQPTNGVKVAEAKVEAAQTKVDPAPAKRPPARVAEAPAPKAKPKAPVARPAPQKVVRRVAPAPARSTAPKVVRETAPRPVPVVPSKPVALAAPAPAGFVTACPGASPLSQRYMRRGNGYSVRCGPQAEPIVTGRLAPSSPQRGTAPQPYRSAGMMPGVAAAPARIVAPAAVTAPVVSAKPARAVGTQTRIVPKHVAINRVNTTNVKVPKGYRKVWEDDRLNPHRAEQTLEGRADMLLVWTQTLPRRLVNKATGEDVTAKVPLIYPYLDIETQRRKLGRVKIVERDGQVVKRVLRYRNAAPIHRDARPIKTAPVYSSRSAPTAQPSTKAGYVQVGVFGSPANAQRAARQIAALGLPARIGKQTRGGKTYHSVQAGPIAGGSAQAALGQLRRAGYRDAYLRR
ncbi:SPOR domain-containing protein [Sulfitobacter sp. KE34]|uniref:SPOR domain-containing protein n=1 Tax=Sulfitobacter faviae TaxID=1775881 RepID=A0AAX3LM97_9RHOB|nr:MULTISPECIES: SPOR domain-containing protein [Sulfitobacter]MDF3348763.1 SPOR domain-containing protein [Sulfitobacter sp. KE12]MDF3352434.1 SPOR domain-containing protein [Sulfitobacter sp. KE27]MDF3356081.1 SPOR domain-containing protein [Sulfitobacter sp. KE33]MDF3360509.1 SPOR domain-containing protein [Sulfitobacter sp. Ks41]MDF3363505.1 SPOR domain-containing protein [Sulfitobacter sp. Ks34]